MIEKPEDLAKIYSSRFSGNELYRLRVWEILIQNFLEKWIRRKDNILDLGSGHAEFINQVSGKRKWAMDLNPEAGSRLTPPIVFLQQNCAEPWNLPASSLDLVFTSNFFEHLFDKEALQKTLRQAYRALRPGGTLLALGPNIRLLPGAYWDFWDHYLPLTERSLAEAGKLCGFKIEEAMAATLPYSMSLGFRPPLWMLRLYLNLPFLWRFFGKQFLVVMRK
jgi:SAM-dependent methyltransferase